MTSTVPAPMVESPLDALREEEGQDLAEYAILIGLIAFVVVGSVSLFGGELTSLYDSIVGTLPFDF